MSLHASIHISMHATSTHISMARICTGHTPPHRSVHTPIYMSRQLSAHVYIAKKLVSVSWHQFLLDIIQAVVRKRAYVSACLHACMPACLPVYMSAYLHFYLSACLHVCMSACLHACMSACLHACMSACLHAYMSACLHAYMSACLHAYIPTCLHAYIPTCPVAQSFAAGRQGSFDQDRVS